MSPGRFGVGGVVIMYLKGDLVSCWNRKHWQYSTCDNRCYLSRERQPI
jgi:hypothetical protein